MFQWIESATKVTKSTFPESFCTVPPPLFSSGILFWTKTEQAVDGKQVEETVYNYTKAWSASHQTFSGPEPPIRSNPPFPSWLPAGSQVPLSPFPY